MLITLESRSLTARQRAILQQLADDLEGRTPASSGTPPTPAAHAAKSSSDELDSEAKSSPGLAGKETEGECELFCLFLQHASHPKLPLEIGSGGGGGWLRWLGRLAGRS